ncbi:hypothetical protein AVEN_124710-1 [Araneus ventricosus]|uniref:Tc1-like transposase DDE domain-containing protein n=1 Tax=Araneus ventricosus TaxID=182803 RepID=A0A4Y2PS96_ARAVE|nr:hypothetical protein AVEN_124710-1 [Araneus ventricosus]
MNRPTELPKFPKLCDWLIPEMFLPYLRLFRSNTDEVFIFMDDNKRPDCVRAVERVLKSEDITKMDCSAYSPNSNIEDVWDVLGRRYIRRRTPQN